jgi:hypothetical protein
MIPKLRLPSGILRVASVVAVLVALFGASFYFQQQSEHAAANQTRGLEDRIEQLTKEFKFSQQAIQVAPDKAVKILNG